ncbi:hypothetical protein GGI20_000506 [Coemansia sp. BCRC 34301]|nr:hypothetical protein GGI20_000506 [Coemansia sp. BCRC 34301]
MVLMVRFPDLLHTCEHKNSCKYRHAFGLDCECVYILMEGINSIVVPDKLLEFSKHEHGHVNAMYIGMDSREVEYSINFDDRFFVVPFECTTPETAVTEIQKLLKFYDDPITI